MRWKKCTFVMYSPGTFHSFLPIWNRTLFFAHNTPLSGVCKWSKVLWCNFESLVTAIFIAVTGTYGTIWLDKYVSSISNCIVFG